ncbi:aminoglycoside 6'-N-acetyltransferase [Fibrella aquatica]|uniref:aminoglycoside 6'-N-acetyltransferase n=1 Tax=Fibrella aquatica TaxID=3242487 RepID=UPI00352263DF
MNEVTRFDFQDWFDMARQLWPDHDTDDMTDALRRILQSSVEAAFILRDGEKKAVGFINLSLRYDTIPGATQKPVAYIEGVFVQSEGRKKGYGALLIQRAEEWARYQGCNELTADVDTDNAASQAFHRQMGFEEVDRVVTFMKSV